MKISVVTPSYNNARYLKKNLESVLAQTHQDHEHIVVDGGSSDGTVELLEQYGDRIRWISEPDNGMYEAINKGLRMASGDVVAYLNADDRYYPDTLEQVAVCFDGRPEIDFVYGGYTPIDEGEQPLVSFRAVPYLPCLLKRGGALWAQPSCFWKRGVHEKIGYFDESMKLAGDWDFFRRFFWQGLKGKRIARPLSKFMLRSDALSFAMKDAMHQEAWKSLATFGITKDDWLYKLNQVLFHATNLDRYLVYVPKYIPLRHGTFRAFAMKKLMRGKG